MWGGDPSVQVPPQKVPMLTSLIACLVADPPAYSSSSSP